RHDIAQAVRKFVERYASLKEIPDASQVEAEFPQMLMTSGIPDPDVLIRTSGEQRISNFLLWQCAYAEMIFVDTLWPDFEKTHLEQAMAEYASRDRRFGSVRSSGRQSGSGA